MRINYISILSCEEYEKYCNIIPESGRYWWTKTSSFSPGRVKRIKNPGDGCRAGLLPDDISGVRPCAVLEFEPSDKEFWMKHKSVPGSKVRYGLWTWTVLDVNKDALFILCDSEIARYSFDLETNVWDNSHLKRWLTTYGNDALLLYDIEELGKIEEIRLLTDREYGKYRSLIPDLTVTWWLQSTYDDACARFCYTDFPRSVCVNRDGDGVKHSVRPVIKIKLDGAARRLPGFAESIVGLVFYYGKYTWIVLDYNPIDNTIFALCNTTIGKRTFVAESQVWDNSDLKVWLETDGIKKITTRRKNM